MERPYRLTSPRLLTAGRAALSLTLGLLALVLTGCYTQLAVVEHEYYEPEPDYVEVEKYDDSTVVNNYYYEDDYYADYEAYPYNRYFSRLNVGFYSAPTCWDPFYAYDPYCYSAYDPFFFGYNFYDPFFHSFYDPFGYRGYGFHRAYYPGYTYVYAPYYGGYRYDSPYAIRRRGDWEPRGRTMGRGELVDVSRTARGMNGARGTIGRGTLGNDGRDTRGRDVVRTGTRSTFGSDETSRTGRSVVRSGSRGTGTSSEGTVTRSTRPTRGTVAPNGRSTSRGVEGRSSSGRSGSTGVRSRPSTTRDADSSSGRGSYEAPPRTRSTSPAPAVRRGSSGDSSRSSGSVGRSSSPPPPRSSSVGRSSSPPPRSSSVGRSSSGSSSGSSGTRTTTRSSRGGRGD